jgi:hypothetical protein
MEGREKEGRRKGESLWLDCEWLKGWIVNANDSV